MKWLANIVVSIKILRNKPSKTVGLTLWHQPKQGIILWQSLKIIIPLHCSIPLKNWLAFNDPCEIPKFRKCSLTIWAQIHWNTGFGPYIFCKRRSLSKGQVSKNWKESQCQWLVDTDFRKVYLVVIPNNEICWWLNQTLWKLRASQIGAFPQGSGGKQQFFETTT